MSGSPSTSAAAVIDHIRNKGLRGIERDRRAFSRSSYVTEILALDFKSLLRFVKIFIKIEVNR